MRDGVRDTSKGESSCPHKGRKCPITYLEIKYFFSLDQSGYMLSLIHILQTGKKDKFVFLKDPYLFLKEQGLSAHEDNTDGSTRIYVQPHANVYVALRERS